MDPAVKGYLILRIEEASGRTKKDEFVWDTNVESEFQAFVKGGRAVWLLLLLPGMHQLQCIWLGWVGEGTARTRSTRGQACMACTHTQTVRSPALVTCEPPPSPYHHPHAVDLRGGTRNIKVNEGPCPSAAFDRVSACVRARACARPPPCCSMLLLAHHHTHMLLPPPPSCLLQAQTKRSPLIGETVTWREDLVL